MKTWNETRDVLVAVKSCLDSNQSCVLVVLTHVKGSAFRRPGAKLLIRADGSMTGNVSGGCLENDLRERAMICLSTQSQATIHYNTGSDEDVIWGLGLGCDGELDLLLVPIVDNTSWIDDVLTRMETREAFSLSWTCVDGPASAPAIGPSTGENIFVDELVPPPNFMIIGAGDDSIPLARQADAAGFRVTVADHRSGYLTAERFPGLPMIQIRPESAGGKLSINKDSMVVIKNHALEMDKKWAAFFDQTEVKYIGLLGPKKRCEQIREHMTSGRQDRVYGPAGIDIGAEGAEQIALSVVAELLSVCSQRPVIHLRDREGAIHTR